MIKDYALPTRSKAFFVLYANRCPNLSKINKCMSLVYHYATWNVPCFHSISFTTFALNLH